MAKVWKGAEGAAKRSKPAKRVKVGTSKTAVETRKAQFIAAYITNGRNATQAAITAGYKRGKSAELAAGRLLKDEGVSRAIAETAKKACQIAGLSVERHAIEVARLAYADPRKLYRDGRLLDVADMDDDAAAAVASVEIDEIGVDGAVVGHTKKLKLWDKNTALTTGAKILGMFEADNLQKGPSVVVVAGLDTEI